ncbi:MAG: glycosyltransferase family 25 protein [Bacteroidia bacterium]|nr:glycosyltransferase family 25 protein [Bacteroidia bacterium]
MIDAATARLLENYFDKIFVVSIERVKDRHTQVSQQLQGLSFDFFFGIDKQVMNWEEIKTGNAIYDEIKAKKYSQVGKGMKEGEVACALSHRGLYEEIVEKKYQRVLIFEDDVLPLSENLSELPAILEELPRDWDLVYFGYIKHEKVTAKLKCKQAFYKIISSFRLIKWNSAMIKNMLPLPYSNHLKKAGIHICTHAYAITSQTAAHLISKQTPIAFNADNLLSYVILKGEIKAFVTEPKLFIQENHLNPKHPSIIDHL